jgi:hypothetical protein
MRYRIVPYKRYYAVYEGVHLIAVTVYKKGAIAVVEALKERDKQLEVKP